MQVEKCIDEIKNELILLNEQINSHELLIEKVKLSLPDQIEISATAALLHSFYNGIENIFKRIANRIDQNTPTSFSWHQELLKQMSISTNRRSNVISDNLYNKLNLYLGFRHFFRHAYSYQLKWSKMEKLLFDLKDVFNLFEKEINLFISKINYGD